MPGQPAGLGKSIAGCAQLHKAFGLKVASVWDTQAGRLEDAHTAKDQLLLVSPQDHLGVIRAALPSVQHDRMERFVDGLRKAGLPEA